MFITWTVIAYTEMASRLTLYQTQSCVYLWLIIWLRDSIICNTWANHSAGGSRKTMGITQANEGDNQWWTSSVKFGFFNFYHSFLHAHYYYNSFRGEKVQYNESETLHTPFSMKHSHDMLYIIKNNCILAEQTFWLDKLKKDDFFYILFVQHESENSCSEGWDFILHVRVLNIVGFQNIYWLYQRVNNCSFLTISMQIQFSLL